MDKISGTLKKILDNVRFHDLHIKTTLRNIGETKRRKAGTRLLDERLIELREGRAQLMKDLRIECGVPEE